jgi:hypothetical protein
MADTACVGQVLELRQVGSHHTAKMALYSGLGKECWHYRFPSIIGFEAELKIRDVWWELGEKLAEGDIRLGLGPTVRTVPVCQIW